MRQKDIKKQPQAQILSAAPTIFWNGCRRVGGDGGGYGGVPPLQWWQRTATSLKSAAQSQCLPNGTYTTTLAEREGAGGGEPPMAAFPVRPAKKVQTGLPAGLRRMRNAQESNGHAWQAASFSSLAASPSSRI
ncbi:hypothetical protein CCHR01_01051 [Colletotrichum chrysophilum]|uniref:Uncharacterized protein n=1 Tax=Colletotrichum chrysophilum TaxID=1836956 RepID=A0AAD9AYD1_9PEZI|nr:hypothetical protein CCHR01_01051 [Colletotrichum chrysophilum]